ncbi:MAG: hypothetical protein MUF22_05895 [Chitinispirillaceae bacterium]|jgi:hypothetical protein|nr:hypothetical protein [Chitinispirillaceae bacterium]
METVYTNPNDLVIGIILAMAVLMPFVPRNWVLVPLFMTATYVTLGQFLTIGTAHFTMIRILVIFGFIRVFARGEYRGFRPTTLDTAVALWTVAAISAYTLLWGTTHAFVNRMGFCLDSTGVYFLCRIYLRTMDDVVRLLALSALLMIPLAASMINEYMTGRNIFAILGGVPDISEIRNNKVRCQGSFRHPILMGTFGATMIPLMASLWYQGRVPRIVAGSGIAAAAVITFCSGSSGALLAAMAGIGGLAAWPLRRHLGQVRWAGVAAVLLLQLAMNAPFWYVFARLSPLSGGTGWHRAYLIDQSIRYFGEWWLLGAKVTAHWMPSGLLIDPTKADITNQFLAQGVNGGLITMILFIAILVRGFGVTGYSVSSHEDFPDKFLAWTMGTALFVHTVSFMSVSYFDQILVFFLFLLAAIATGGEAAWRQS